MTRPRSASGTIACTSVFDPAICTIIEKPTGTSSSADSQNDRDVLTDRKRQPGRNNERRAEQEQVAQVVARRKKPDCQREHR